MNATLRKPETKLYSDMQSQQAGSGIIDRFPG